MSSLLKRDPVWLESLTLSNTSSVVKLLSSDGCKITVPAALLLATSPLVRAVLSADHCPPAYIEPVISLPSVTGDVLKVVQRILATGIGIVSPERQIEVKEAFKMLRIEAQLVGLKFKIEIEVKEETVIEDDAKVQDLSKEIPASVAEVQANTEETDIEDDAEVHDHDISKEFVTAGMKMKVLEVFKLQRIEPGLIDLQVQRDSSTDLVQNVKIEPIETNDLADTLDNDWNKNLPNIVKSEICTEDTDELNAGQSVSDKSAEAEHLGVNNLGKKKTLKSEAGIQKIQVMSVYSLENRCNQCELTFADRGCLMKHIHNQHPEHFGFCCDQCPKKYSRKKRLLEHIQVVHEMKPINCPFCDNIFRSKSSVRRHILNQHKEHYKFSCDQCSKKYKRNDQLLEHIQIVHEMKTYNCPLCDKILRSKSMVKLHVQAVHGTKISNCHFCDKKFQYITTLRNHIRDKHGDSGV
eukprot:GFUD01015455.1.p1 GENE.GFUD01015455.1~~GFUD01015455.1.p1  ORF type:complete len:466 (+),score=101.55 GFUD01015455.1:44-1441(+)